MRSAPYWLLFGFAALATMLSILTGLAATLIALGVHIGSAVRAKERVSPARVIILALAPVAGLVGAATFFLMGPGF